MFTFQLCSLHISKDVPYDFNNFISSTIYQIPMSSQRRQRVVGCGHYCIVGDSLAHNYQETILMATPTCSMVKTVKQKPEVDDVLLRYFDVLASFIFIELFDSSSSEDLTSLPLLRTLPKNNF